MTTDIGQTIRDNIEKLKERGCSVADAPIAMIPFAELDKMAALIDAEFWRLNEEIRRLETMVGNRVADIKQHTAARKPNYPF